MPHPLHTQEIGAGRSGLIGGGGNVSSVPGPVCVDEVSWFVQKLVCVGSKVISLGLEERGVILSILKSFVLKEKFYVYRVKHTLIMNSSLKHSQFHFSNQKAV